jgi:hypothetical protein
MSGDEQDWFHGATLVENDEFVGVEDVRVSAAISVTISAPAPAHRLLTVVLSEGDGPVPSLKWNFVFDGIWWKPLAKTPLVASVWQITAVEIGPREQVRFLDAKSIDALPGLQVHGGYIYVLMFAHELIKVGSTANPRQRLECHRREAAAFGAGITHAWLSPLHTGYRETERLLLDFIGSEAAETIRRERFLGVSFSSAVGLACHAFDHLSGVLANG